MDKNEKKNLDEGIKKLMQSFGSMYWKTTQEKCRKCQQMVLCQAMDIQDILETLGYEATLEEILNEQKQFLNKILSNPKIIETYMKETE